MVKAAAVGDKGGEERGEKAAREKAKAVEGGEVRVRGMEVKGEAGVVMVREEAKVVKGKARVVGVREEATATEERPAGTGAAAGRVAVRKAVRSSNTRSLRMTSRQRYMCRAP